jgi:hypothetical protein
MFHAPARSLHGSLSKASGAGARHLSLWRRWSSARARSFASPLTRSGVDLVTVKELPGRSTTQRGDTGANKGKNANSGIVTPVVR